MSRSPLQSKGPKQHGQRVLAETIRHCKDDTATNMRSQLQGSPAISGALKEITTMQKHEAVKEMTRPPADTAAQGGHDDGPGRLGQDEALKSPLDILRRIQQSHITVSHKVTKRCSSLQHLGVKRGLPLIKDLLLKPPGLHKARQERTWSNAQSPMDAQTPLQKGRAASSS